MNKLVSKDPILRFKLGKKIIKAQGGTTTSNLPVLASLYKSLPNPVSTVTKSPGLLSRVGGIVGRYLPAFLLASDIESRRKLKAKELETRLSGAIVGANAVEKALESKKVENDILSTIDHKSLPPTKTSVEPQVKQNPKSATSTRTQSGINWNNRYSSFVSGLNKEQLLYLLDNNITNARLLQLHILNNNGSVGKYRVDGHWGNDSIKGFNDFWTKLKVKFTTPTEVDNSGIEKAKERIETPNNPVNFGYRSNFNYVNGNIRNLGFNNYQGLVSHVRANPNDPFSQDLIARWGDVNTWNLLKFENAYRIGGHYGNMNMRRLLNGLAQWAGENDARYDAREAAYGRQVSHPQLYNDSWKQALTLSYRKQGGQLVSKNPVKRFKQKTKSFIMEAKFPR